MMAMMSYVEQGTLQVSRRESLRSRVMSPISDSDRKMEAQSGKVVEAEKECGE